MPYIRVQLGKPVSPAETLRLADGITDVMTTILHKKQSLVSVSLETIPASQWFIGGQNMAEQTETTAFVSAKITEGTNTVEEKAKATAAIHTLLGEVLGTLAEASYIVLDCLPATDWGYASRTQASRKANAAST
jgi:4-oxalocrotonate tautomerase